MDERMADIGERIRAARRKKKISQTRFGKLIGRSMNGMAMIERGEADPPVGLLMRIAEALEEDFEFLVTGRRKPQSFEDLSTEELQDILEEIDDLGVSVRDLELGIVEFPSVFEGKDICFCWQLGEDRVSFWYYTDEDIINKRKILRID